MLPRATWTWKRLFYRSLAAGSLALSPFFALFLFQSITKVRNLSLQEWGVEECEWFSLILTIIAIYFTTANFLGDPSSVNPIEQAESLLKTSERDEKNSLAYTQSFIKINQFFATFSFFHIASDNAIALSALTSNNRSYYLGLGIPFSLFSVLSQHIRAKEDLIRHSDRFIHSFSTIHTQESFLLKIAKSPLKSLEVFIEVLCYLADQGIAAGYTADQLAKVFDLPETNPLVIPWVTLATFVTMYVTVFSKVLPIYDDYFNPSYHSLSKGSFCLDSALILSRAGTLSWLIYRFGPENLLINNLLAFSLCFISISHAGLVLYQKHQQESALANRYQAELFDYLFDLESDRERMTLNPEQLFNKIAQHYETPTLRKAVTIINLSARVGQLLSLIGFVVGVLEAVDANGYAFPFNFKDTIALAILWGTPIAILEGKKNQEPLIHAASYYRAKALIGAPTETLAHKNCLTRTVASFFYSKNQYSPTRLRKALHKLKGGTETEMVPLLRC